MVGNSSTWCRSEMDGAVRSQSDRKAVEKGSTIGGGVVILYGKNVSGAGSVVANGASGSGVGNQSNGGTAGAIASGGAGGGISIIFGSAFSDSITVSAKGGSGGTGTQGSRTAKGGNGGTRY